MGFLSALSSVGSGLNKGLDWMNKKGLMSGGAGAQAPGAPAGGAGNYTPTQSSFAPVAAPPSPMAPPAPSFGGGMMPSASGNLQKPIQGKRLSALDAAQ